MSNKTLQSLFHYKRWADGELLDAIATLDAQQYGEAHHTCLRIFNHIHVVDAIFQAWTIDRLPPAHPPPGMEPATWACALTGIEPGTLQSSG